MPESTDFNKLQEEGIKQFDKLSPLDKEFCKFLTKCFSFNGRILISKDSYAAMRMAFYAGITVAIDHSDTQARADQLMEEMITVADAYTAECELRASGVDVDSVKTKQFDS